MFAQSINYLPAFETEAFSCTFCLLERINVHGGFLGEESH